MIFALYDFYKYWFHKGIYSDEGLKKEGAVLASEEILPAIENIKSGFMMVHTRNSFLSWLVLYYTGPGIWSHMTIIIEGGILYDVTTQGGIKHHISDYFDGKTYVGVFNLNVKEERLERASLFAELSVPGCKFAWKKTFTFWLLIITAGNCEYRIRYSLDIIITLLFPLIFFWHFLVIRVCIFFVIALYVAVVLFNKLVRKVPYKDELEEDEDKNHNEQYENEERKYDLCYEALLGCRNEEFSNRIGQIQEVFFDSPKFLLPIFNKMANLLCELKRFDRAKITYEKAVNICENSCLRNSLEHAGILNNYAGFFAKTNQPHKAKQVMQKAIEMILDNDENEDEKKKLLARLSRNISILSGSGQIY